MTNLALVTYGGNLIVARLKRKMGIVLPLTLLKTLSQLIR